MYEVITSTSSLETHGSVPYLLVARNPWFSTILVSRNPLSRKSSEKTQAAKVH
jgi:hypothetical protein